MELESVAEALRIEKWRLKGAMERKNAFLIDDFSPPYILFRKELRHVEKGTSVFLGDSIEVIRGFPRIRRAFYLEPMLQKHFKDNVVIEEKMNGYNVRAALVDGKFVAITRGGFVCPYTTSKLEEDENLLKFLKYNQELVVCGEVVGMENPYVAHEYLEAERFGFFCFDLRYKSTNKALPIEERNSLLEKYQLKSVRLLGTYRKGEIDSIFEIVRELGREGREGVVIKDPEMKLSPVKYTPSETNTSDLAYAFRYPYEYGRDFFFSRIIREGYQAAEWEEGEEELEARAMRLGESILFPMVRSIRKVMDGDVLTEDFRVRVNSEEKIKALLIFLRRQGINFILEDSGIDLDEHIYLIKRLRNSTTDKIKSYLSGRFE